MTDLRLDHPDKPHLGSVVAVDLFCGVGGLTRGLVNGGIRVSAGFDLDSNCKFPYEENNRSIFVEKDIRQLEADDLRKHLPCSSIRVLAGCAPCQPFSTYNGKKRASSEKWNLLTEFGRLAKALQPDIVTMENVPRLCGEPVFKTFISSLDGYHVSYSVVDCTKYGVPQTRKRLVLLASRLGPISLIPPTHSQNPISVRSTIGKLPPLEAGTVDPRDPLHAVPSLSSKNLARIRISTQGGSWRDWPKRLRTECHKRPTGESYKSVYGRMNWDEPSPTITTLCFGFGNGRFGHPDQDRAISLREAALLQTFPQEYRFMPPNVRARFNVMGRLIGNAVPVRLGEVIAESISVHLKQTTP